jgi:alkanesulfonate monooxygenase SsuD/methylene tetrahydromethanopterin reductase-like flavin-dependent oxidoreductase (luciferase family)
MVWRVAPSWYAARNVAIDEACAETGRDPATFRRTIGLYTLVGHDETDARAAFERGRAAMPGGAIDGDTYESWCADTLSGTPEQVIDRIRVFEEMGVEEIVVAPWVLPFAVPEPDRFDVFVERVLRPLRAERG